MVDGAEDIGLPSAHPPAHRNSRVLARLLSLLLATYPCPGSPGRLTRRGLPVAALILGLSLTADAPLAEGPDPPTPAIAETTTDGTPPEPGADAAKTDGRPGEVEIERAAISILGTRVEPGTRERLILRITESFVGALVETPVIVTAGREPGPTLCVVAGIHGDEINGVEIVRRLMARIDPERLQGNLVAIPIANIAAFRRGSRYLPDRRDLNRFFPGRPFGSSASRIAHALFTQVVERCDGLIDLHTGSFLRTNVHQLRADLSHEGTAMLAHQYGAEVIVHHRGGGGTLRRAATDAGIPAVTVEAGQPSRFDRTEVEKALEGLHRVLVARGMLAADDTAPPAPPSVTYFRTSWTRSDQGGILVSRVELGDEVNEGDVLGTISDPLSGDIESIRAPHAGQIIGMAFDQLVMPGFAAYHIGLRPIPGSPLPDPSSESAEDRDETDHADPDSADMEERPE